MAAAFLEVSPGGVSRPGLPNSLGQHQLAAPSKEARPAVAFERNGRGVVALGLASAVVTHLVVRRGRRSDHCFRRPLRRAEEADAEPAHDEDVEAAERGSRSSSRGSISLLEDEDATQPSASPTLVYRGGKLEDDEEWEEEKRGIELATVEEQKDFARAAVADARQKAKARQAKVAKQAPFSADVGLGNGDPNSYVEIKPRPGPDEDGTLDQPVGRLVVDHLGITYEQASKLVNLGSVWVFDDELEFKWERVKRHQRIRHDKFLRVFPTPERFKMCYVDDWSDRLQLVDRDFVVVNKPPMLPCFPQVSNGRESLPECIKDSLSLRPWGGDSNIVTDELVPLHEVDHEVSGLVVLSRHSQARHVFEEWMEERKVTFEYVALCQGMPAERLYRHFYRKVDEERPGQPLPPLYEEIPEGEVRPRGRATYNGWDFAEMEVIATAPLPGGCAAVRIRAHRAGLQERIRTQLAMIGCHVLNDGKDPVSPASHEPRTTTASAVEDDPLALPEGIADGAITTQPADGRNRPVPDNIRAKLVPLSGTSRERRRAAAKTNRPTGPVGLHLARIVFGGRTVTCAPPPFWPEGAAAAVAVKLTPSDIKDLIHGYLIQRRGGRAKIGDIGGRFNVKVDLVEQFFPVDRPAGLVFASQDAYTDWICERRVSEGEKLSGRMRPHITKEEKEKDYLVDKYGFHPRWKMRRKNMVKPLRT